MTTQHYNYKIVTKTKGHNIIAKSAYNARTKMYDEMEEKNKYPHTSKKDHMGTVVLLPADAPAKYLNPANLWNDVQRNEKGRMAKNLILAIPNELGIEAGKKLVLEHINREFVSKGFCCQVDFHLSYGKSGKPNFHAHILVSERQIIHGKWADAKSHKIYLDEHNNIIEPILSPKLHFGKLQFDKNNNVIMELGYKKLQYDQNGKPLLNEKGYPVTIDIRVPAKSKNAKRKTWHERKNPVTDIDKKGNVNRLRKAWQDLQNEYYKKYNIRTENGKILQVDHRPFKEKFADIPEELRPEPTKRAKGGIVRDSIIEYNKSVMDRRRLIKTALEKEADLKTKKFIFSQKKIAELDAIIEAENNFCRDIDPKKLYVDRWETNYNSLKSQVEEHDRKVIEMLRRNLDYNQKQRSVIDKTDKYKKEKIKRLNRHAAAMQKIINGILSFRNNNIDIGSLAGQSYDKLNNAKKIAFVRNVIGDKTAKIYASFLTRTKPDRSDALDGLIAKPPAIPDEKVNSKLIENATEAIAGTETISIDFNKISEETPHKTVVDSISAYHTALGFYNDKLTGNSWKTRTIIDSEKIETPEKINQDFQDEVSKIANSAKEFRFTGTVEERIKQVMHLYEQTRQKKIPYNPATKIIIGEELKSIKSDLIKKIVGRLSPLQRTEILNHCNPTSTLSDNDKIEEYLNSKSIRLKDYISDTGCQTDYNLYKKFGEFNKLYFGLHTKQTQNTKQQSQQQSQQNAQNMGRN